MSRPEFVEKIEDANENKAKTLRQRIERDVNHGQVDKQQPFSLRTFAAFQSHLINFHDYPVDFRNYFEESFLDMDLLQDLERSKVINWCRTAKRLYPLKTTGDGNCLLHAVSLALWAIEDTLQLLRRLVYFTLSTDPRGAFKLRWLYYRRSNQDAGANFQLNTAEFSVEWESIVKSAADIQQQQGEMLPYATLESFHLYVLANVLRRPIIVIADKRARNVYGQSLQESNIGGIYLPLETVPTQCIKTPVIISYNMNHFAPLVIQEGDSNLRMDVVPIVTHELEMMVVHYLLPGEEQEVVRLLENYLQMTETALTETDSIRPILSVQLEERKLPEDLNLMEDLRQDCENRFRQWIDQKYGSENVVLQTQPAPTVTPKQNIVVPQRMPELQDNNRSPSLAKIMMPVPSRQTPLHAQVDQTVVDHSSKQKCLTTGCMMYGSPEMYGLCSKCFMDYTVIYHNQEQALRRLHDAVCVTPSAPMPTIPPPDRYIDLSIVPEKCKTESCDCLCSQTTFPYCFECYPDKQKHKATQAQSTASGNVHVFIPETTGWLDKEQQAIINKPHSGANTHQVGVITQKLNVAQTVTVQNELSRPTCKTASSQKPVFLSMKDEMCPSEGCRNHVSRNTEPVCHECYNKMQRTPKLGKPAQDVQGQNFNSKFPDLASEVEPPFEVLRLESNQSCTHEPTQFVLPSTASVETSPRLVTPATGLVAPPVSLNTLRCKAEGCYNHAVPANNGLCGVCYYNYMFGVSNIPEKENFQLSPNAEALNRLSGPAKKCSSPGCENTPPAGKHICHRCYSSSGSKGLHINASQIMNVSEEKSAAAKIQGLIFPGENLPGQFLASAMTPASRSLESPPTGQNITNMTEMHSEASNSYPRSYVEKKHLCATPGCQGIRLTNTFDLCHTCYTRATPKKESRSDLDTEENVKPALNSSTVLCNTEMLLTNEEEKRLDPIVTEQMVSCAGKTCSKLIYPPKKLCDQCQEILEHAYASKSKQDFRFGRQNATTPFQSNAAPQQPRPHTDRVIAKCIVVNCDRYGDPATGNMCKAHFEYTQRTITTTGQLNVPAVIWQNVPSAGQQDVHPVNPKLSNPNSQDTYSTSANLPPFRHRSGSNEDGCTAALTHLDLSRKSNSKCIIQECFNFGSPLNQGMCNACVRTHFDLSRRSNSKCIIQECLNFGSSQNQGMCNQCFRAYLAE